jgi:hypothetical protein
MLKNEDSSAVNRLTKLYSANLRIRLLMAAFIEEFHCGFWHACDLTAVEPHISIVGNNG